MGVLSRKRSLLIKLTVIVSTAWFTIAFLLYSEDRSQSGGIALSLQSNDVNRDSRDLREANELEPINPFKKEDTPGPPPKKEQADHPVLLPPQSMAGEMGKPVVLATNLTGESNFILFLLSLSQRLSLPFSFFNLSCIIIMYCVRVI